MAVINQSPAGQPSISSSTITFNDVIATGSPFRQSRKTVEAPSAKVTLGDSTSLSVTGQLWPLGLI
jgi:hypothetical protein